MVERMRRAALRRALPPRWLGVILSILFGGLCGSTAASLEIVNALFLSLIVLTFAAMRRTLLAMARRSSFGFSLPLIAVQAFGVLLILAMIAGGRIGIARWGLTWAPLATALGSAATIYLLFQFKMSQFRASLESEGQL